MISKGLYYLILKPLSLLPLSFLYLLNRPVRFFLFSIFGYRKEVIANQLERSFPNKSKKERDRITSKFHIHFVDIILESIRAFSISLKECNERCQLENPEVLSKYFEQGRNVALVLGHYASWEIPCMMAQSHFNNQFYVIYAKLKDSFLNEKIKKSRSLSGCKLVPRKEIFQIVENEEDPFAIAFMVDQSPTAIQKAHWGQFLNQPTAFNYGLTHFAQTYDMVVIFAEVKKKSRGMYAVELHALIDKPKDLPAEEITKIHAATLEKIIQKRPELWLWSHRRWKYEPPKDFSVS